MPFRSGTFGGISGFSITLQNNRLGWIDIASDSSCRIATGDDESDCGVHFMSEEMPTCPEALTWTDVRPTIRACGASLPGIDL